MDKSEGRYKLEGDFITWSFNLKNYKEAENYFDRSLKINKNIGLLRYTAKNFIVLKKYNLAVPYLETLINKEPKDKRYYRWLIYCLKRNIESTVRIDKVTN